ncbi:MAG: Purine nucleoside phosphoramidase [Chlamydiia bacterium]|nr:Purine nucleoside phosphoramidase [Chlamydiia bacterium]
MSEVTVFEKIIAGEIPCEKVYESDRVLVIRDIAPQAPTHLLIIPKSKRIDSVDHLVDEDCEIVGELFLTARDVAKKVGLGSGYRLVMNVGRDGGQTVPYMHLHLLAGKKMDESTIGE